MSYGPRRWHVVSMTRVLFTSVAAYGHVNPLLPLAMALSDAGHQVAVATGCELLARVEAAGCTALAAGLDMDAAFARLAERYPDAPYNRLVPLDIMGWYVPHLFGEIMAPAMLSDLEPLVRMWRPDVVVHETFELGGPIAAASAGIPSVSHTLGLRFDDRLLDAAAAAVAPLWLERGLEADPDAGLYRYLCLDTTPPSFQPDSSRHRYDRIRPLRPCGPPPLDGEVLPGWMRHRREVPLLYMTLGTNTNSDLAMFRSVIDGLCDLHLDVLVTLGFGRDPVSIGTLPENVHVENYVSQSLLLPHCSAVICHAGAGTTLGALAHGLPLLVLPQGADQYLISDQVVRSGAGLGLPPAEVTPSTVQTNVVALLGDPAYRTAARALRREIEAMPGPEAAVQLIESAERLQVS